MKVKRVLITFVLGLALLIPGARVSAGKIPPRPPDPSFGAGVIPAWASPVSPSPAAAGMEVGDGPIEPELWRALSEAEPDQYVPVVVTMREQADWENALEVTLCDHCAHNSNCLGQNPNLTSCDKFIEGE